MKILVRAMILACVGVLLIVPVMALQNGNQGKNGNQPAPPLVDTALPDITITSPTEGWVVGRSVEVEFYVSDPERFANFELYVGGELRNTISAKSKSLVLKWRTRKDAKGEYTLEVMGHDRSGNIASSPLVTIGLWK